MTNVAQPAAFLKDERRETETPPERLLPNLTDAFRNCDCRDELAVKEALVPDRLQL